MCGVCCLSMKVIVILDMVATLILPATLVYVGYILYTTIWLREPLTLLMVIVWSIVISTQISVFLVRSHWDYWWWFFVFVLLGVPVFYLIMPLYSFWHMDDFSWGATREVTEQKHATTHKPANIGEVSANRIGTTAMGEGSTSSSETTTISDQETLQELDCDTFV